MNPVNWLRNGLGILRGRYVGDECPRGTAVPTEDHCSAFCDSVELPTLQEGARARVTCLENPGSRIAMRLAAMGILPGAEIHLVQRNPAYVMRVGYNELALDAQSAGMVRVRREPEDQPTGL